MARVDVTEMAAEKAKALLADSEYPAGALRVRVVNGGCSGMRYELLFDDDLSADDEETQQFGLRVFVDSESAEYLEGCRVDFSDELNDSGFKVENPSAATTCGCGESFNVA